MAGCGATEDALDSPPEAIAGRNIVGHVHGGVYPIRGATISLMQTVTGTPGSYGSTAKQLLTTSSDQNGYFTFPDTFTCASNEFAYIVVTGGHSANQGTSVSRNDHVVQVGAIGPCSTLATVAQIDKVNVFVSELSTVAAASALGNFISVVDPNDEAADQVVNIGAPFNNSNTAKCQGPANNPTQTSMTCTAAGLSHAFTNAVSLVDSVRFDNSFPTGQANNVNPNSTNGPSAIPAPLINTLANILQQCVDSIDVGTASSGTTTYTPSSQCTSLFTAAKSPGGTVPADTLQVAMNMAKYPTNNISGLFGQTAPNVPFTPYLATQPTSFAVSIFYGVAYSPTTGGSSIVAYPIDLALDYADNAYVLYANATGTAGVAPTAVAEWQANGLLVSPYPATPNATYTHPRQIALDASSNVYTTDNNSSASDAVLRLNGSTLYPVATLQGATGIAGDMGGNLFVSSTYSGKASATEYTGASLLGSLSAQTAGGAYTSATARNSSSGTYPAYGVALDANQNVWAAGLSGTSPAYAIAWVNNATVAAPLYTAGGGASKAFTTASPFSVALNSAGTAYFPTAGQMNSATVSGGIVTAHANLAAAGNTTATDNLPHRSQVDGAGTVFWTDNESTGSLFFYNPLSGAVTSILPCFAFAYGANSYCITSSTATTLTAGYTPAYLRGLGIDSAGDVWYAADSNYGAVIETLGLAAPTWPLLAYGHPGVKPQ